MKELLLEDFPLFAGSDFKAKHDYGRLKGQVKRVFDLMSDGQWRSLDTIAQLTGDPHASISAQLRNLRKERFGGHTVLKKRSGNKKSGLFVYRLAEDDD